MNKKITKQIFIGNIAVGGDAPISVQSMVNRPPHDLDAILAQINELHNANCDIVRVAVPDEEAGKIFKEVVANSPIPVIADIHFRHELALMAIEAGADGLRLNPGNIASTDKIERVVKTALEHKTPIRIGVNAGSISKEKLNRYGGPTVEAMVESALEHVAILERLNFDLIKISIKASDIKKSVESYREISKRVDYPLHVGISEAGSAFSGTIKSAIGIGSLLAEGIGDTLRVSLTADPVLEVRTGFEILKVLDLRRISPEIISCPTCGRCEIDLFKIAEMAEKEMAKIKKPIKIAIMGCVVNGPGEAREADIGIAGGDKCGVIFKKGEIIRKESEENLYCALIEEIKKL